MGDVSCWPGALPACITLCHLSPYPPTVCSHFSLPRIPWVPSAVPRTPSSSLVPLLQSRPVRSEWKSIGITSSIKDRDSLRLSESSEEVVLGFKWAEIIPNVKAWGAGVVKGSTRTTARWATYAGVCKGHIFSAVKGRFKEMTDPLDSLNPLSLKGASFVGLDNPLSVWDTESLYTLDRNSLNLRLLCLESLNSC